MDHQERQAALAEVTQAAYADGYERGEAAGSWVIDGNTSVETAQRILDGYNDGDPEVMDMQPSPLSGEWAGESMNELGLEDASDETLDAYEAGFSDGYWDEVQRSAAAIIGEDD